MRKNEKDTILQCSTKKHVNNKKVLETICFMSRMLEQTENI